MPHRSQDNIIRNIPPFNHPRPLTHTHTHTETQQLNEVYIRGWIHSAETGLNMTYITIATTVLTVGRLILDLCCAVCAPSSPLTNQTKGRKRHNHCRQASHSVFWCSKL